MVAYVGSQADKFKEATTAMNELLTKIPELPANLSLAKAQVKKDIETERITEDNIIFKYLAAQKLGLNHDIRQKVYQSVDGIKMEDVKNFHQKYLSGKPYTYTIVASEKNIPEEELKKVGTLKKLNLEEIFGY